MSDKLDRLVAERVMGWTQHEHMQDCWTHPSFMGGYKQKHYFTPSTDISAAWEVVEHLRKKTKDDGTRKYLVSVVDHDDGKRECVIQPGRLWTMSSCANHENECMAICLAALRAVGVPEAEIQEAMR